MNIADIVISINGRDVGKRFIVIETDDVYSLIADGKGRRLEKPKKKKNKHLKFDCKASGAIAEKLAKGEKTANIELRRLLAEHAKEQPEQQDSSEVKGGAPKCQKTI